MILTVKRFQKTFNGIYGLFYIEGMGFKYYSVENLEKSILPGLYDVNFTHSDRFNAIMPHIIVPDRDYLAGGDAGIRIHVANYPHEVTGCVGIGQGIGNNMVLSSRDAFADFMEIIKDRTDLKIEIKENYGV